ncbi:MarR family transcriptional regulator [Microbacterium sp. STN6]|uniref:MarR family winged helix-turn-helix transcriptional regulator n=1 Tax=Microbacterium sp. STN6 TaxID=2995588 RepID=UPI002260FD87|nr:MarR family transcriptional regulator [Microbacterium sp. STN6]MCX7520707.1 MarR family transcriptional regulator [Microbacterium sp. STN6]
MDDGARMGTTEAPVGSNYSRRHRATAPADAVGRLEWVTQRLARSLQRAVELVAADNDITVAEYHLLLATSDDVGRSNAELARLMFVTPQSANHVLADLERRGFVARTDDPNHGRVRKTALTSAGRTVLKACTDRIAGIEARVLAGLDEEQRRILLPALQQAADTIAGGYFGDTAEELRAVAHRRTRQPPS